MIVICISLFFPGCFFPTLPSKNVQHFFLMLHKNPLSTVQTGHCYCERGPADTFSSAHIGSKRWFITANPPVSLIECDNVKTEVGTQDFALWAAWAERCCRAGLAQKPQQKRWSPPPSLSSKSLLPAPLSPLLPLAVFPSLWQLLMGSFFLAAPSHPSSGSLPFFLPLWIYPRWILWAQWTLPSFNSASSQPCEFD